MVRKLKRAGAAAALIAALVLASAAPAGPSLQLETGIAVTPPRDLQRFELVDHHGEVFDNDRFLGRWSLVMIGFTHCPDVCPTGLHQLAVLKQRLAERDAALEVLFVSVDPDRDTPEGLAGYIGFFDDSLTGATGELDQLRRFADSLEFAWVRVPQGEGRYTIDHSAALALIDPYGRLAGYFLPPLDVGGMKADLAPILGAPSRR